MTPKEKALELVYKYEYLVGTWDSYNDEPLKIEYRLPDMKECALISVTEIINAIAFDFENPSENTIYWLKVKQEIEKL